MLKKLDNRFTISINELIECGMANIDKVDINEIANDYSKYLKSYINNDKIYFEYIEYFKQEIHKSIPEKERELCKFCKKISRIEDDKICKKYFIEANDNFLLQLVLFVNFIESNRQFFYLDELKDLAKLFFEHFEFLNGELNFKEKKFLSIISTHVLLSIREYYKDLDTNIAIRTLNENIEEIENHLLIAKNTDRIVLTLVKPQLKLFRKLLKYFEKVKEIKPLEKKDSYNDDIDLLFRQNNNLIPEVDIKQVYDYFKILTEITNKNQKFYLTEKKLIIFIQSTFVDNNPVKQRFEVTFSRDKIDIRSIFRNFLSECSKFENNNKNLKQKYFKIMDDSFVGFNKTDFDKFHKTNTKIPTLKLLKSK